MLNIICIIGLHIYVALLIFALCWILIDINRNPTVACNQCGKEILKSLAIETYEGDYYSAKFSWICSGCYTFIQKGNGR